MDMPQFMKDMLKVKEEITKKHADVKYGLPLNKLILETLKFKGSVDKAVEHINSINTSELKSQLEKIAKDIAEKRASKKEHNNMNTSELKSQLENITKKNAELKSQLEHIAKENAKLKSHVEHITKENARKRGSKKGSKKGF